MTEPRCPECGHVLSTGEHSDWCMTARDPAALKAAREAAPSLPGEQPGGQER